MSNPIGTIITYYGTQAPEGYFPCDGSSFDPCANPKLFQILGEANTPDLRGYFIRGLDPDALRDPDGATRQLNDEQGDAIRNITGGTGLKNGSSLSSLDSAFYTSDVDGKSGVGGAKVITGYGTITLDASRVVPTAPENRPVNKAMLYCIKHDGKESASIGGFVPNLQIGVETNWPMTYQGKQMYAKLINYGALPNKATRSIPHNIPDVEYIQVSFDYSVVIASGIPNHPVVATHPTSIGGTWGCLVDSTNLSIHTGVDRRNFSAIICVLYTKTTDESVI